MLLATFFGKRTRGEFRAKTADLVNPRQTTFEKRRMQTAAPTTSRRARVGEEARPSRTDRHAFAARALLGCQRTGVRAARRVQGFATFGDATNVWS